MDLHRLHYYYRSARHIARKHLVGCSVSPIPAFDRGGLEFFTAAIRSSRVYLEYGSGGSTIMAASHVSRLVSVEPDAMFAKAVRAALPETEAEISILTPWIGVTRDWSYPVFGRPTPARRARWKRLPRAPWAVLSDTPDLILVDGRFRVACALESLLHIGPATRLLIDDYAGRDYGAVEQFGRLVAMHGRMAEFTKRSDFDEAACRTALETSYADVR
ncbi:MULTISPECIES: hypothetical protein [Bradyrhizobium]|uniref:Class I SAM-dependent methyltransferase n=1 Tax=Bradyrhizobium denitrificans TaxID=2734912 RepID=A0ABS5GAW1_9BRAD|nr:MULTISPECIES: hypothetical protein [Bradyrhizobium]RTM02192.1 MAG: hypothetical protein EKK32_11715 [Bradyrhizobiaceae bacterium]ABQ33313.1 hypothetical protein BBta_1061 [Bradyrhizobium sp. BTAi1]MBR1138467.1 hypothetical protein [Bradyrhizobium denitrificans]MCL8485520.1 hypothetical protein [Bradyrhizobium denitrificans]MDU0954609.1 hypothetical protein [Bradyrhizobium sp.]